MHGLTETEARLRDAAREVAREAAAQAAATDRSEQYPWPMVARMTQAGFMGLTIPQEWGGRGLSYFDAVLVIEEFAKACAVCGRIAVEANMGAIGAIMAYGTPAQKRIAADLVLAGDKPAILITEPEAGSAATDMRTRAVRHGNDWGDRGCQNLDHRRRCLPPAPGLRARHRGWRGQGHRRLHRGARG